MSDKALLTRGELELTQKIQREFPGGGIIHPNIVKELNDSPSEVFAAKLVPYFQNKMRLQVITTNGIVAPKGGIVRMLVVPANEGRAWQETIDAAGPNTSKDHNVREVGEQYPPIPGACERLEEIFIVNFGKGSITPSQDAIAWGKKQHLIPASPRACFAIGEHYPKLHTYLGMDSMAVVSLRECSFEGKRNCYDVWFRGSGRGAGLSWLGGDWFDVYWFAFVRELEPGILGS